MGGIGSCVLLHIGAIAHHRSAKARSSSCECRRGQADGCPRGGRAFADSIACPTMLRCFHVWVPQLVRARRQPSAKVVRRPLLRTQSASTLRHGWRWAQQARRRPGYCQAARGGLASQTICDGHHFMLQCSCRWTSSFERRLRLKRAMDEAARLDVGGIPALVLLRLLPRLSLCIGART